MRETESASKGLEDLVLALSARLVRARPEQLDAAISEALALIGRFLGTGRAYVFVFSPTFDRLSATHEYCAAGVPSALAVFHDIPTAPLAWGLDQVRAGQVVAVTDCDSLPPEAASVAEGMQQLGIKSFITVPLQAAEGVIGGIGFDWYEAPASWSATTTRLLSVVAEILAGVLLRARAENDLRQTDERMKSFISSTKEAVFCYELETPIPVTLTPDEQFERFLDARLVVCNEIYALPRGGARPEELIGRRMRELARGPIERIRDMFVMLLTTGNTPDGAEVKQVQPDGSVRWARSRAQIVQVDGKIHRLWGILRDVTDEKRAAEERAMLESQLRQAQKMESIGLLAGGVAHDFNNLLLVIQNFSRVALDELVANPLEAREAIGQVMEAAKRAAELTRGLLLFSRRQSAERRPLDLNETVRELHGMLARMIRESVEIDFLPGHELGTINADRSQIEQLLVNLCLNAADAIADTGRITIETENVKLNGAYVKAHPWARPGRYVLLTVTDTGAGMSPEVRERIFEPFFTTKDPGRGTGLGLAVVYGVVKQHDGMIHVYSEPGRGTTFKIYLPIVERAASLVGAKVEGPLRGGKETVLVAEDHQMVREVVQLLLERVGYRVIMACDGAEAMARFEAAIDEIDLVLLDAVMPVMNGHVVFQKIRARRPDLPILVASGYAAGVFPEDFFSAQGEDLIAKPYDADQLLRRIRAALDARHAHPSADQ